MTTRSSTRERVSCCRRRRPGRTSREPAARQERHDVVTAGRCEIVSGEGIGTAALVLMEGRGFWPPNAKSRGFFATSSWLIFGALAMATVSSTTAARASCEMPPLGQVPAGASSACAASSASRRALAPKTESHPQLHQMRLGAVHAALNGCGAHWFGRLPVDSGVVGIQRAPTEVAAAAPFAQLCSLSLASTTSYEPSPPAPSGASGKASCCCDAGRRLSFTALAGAAVEFAR